MAKGDKTRAILERIVGTKSKADLADKFKEAFAEKYGLRPDELKFGNDKQIKLTTDSNVTSYLLVTEFRRNN